MGEKSLNLFQLISYFLLFFLTIYGPRLYGSNILDLISLTSIVCIIIGTLNGSFKMIDNKIIFVAILLIFMFLYTLMISVISGINEFVFAGKFIRAFLNFFGVYGLVFTFYKKTNGNLVLLLKLIYLSVLLHSLIMIFQYLLPDFGKFIVEINGYGNDKLFRVTGLTVSYNTLNVVQSFGFFIGIILNKNGKFYYIIGSIVILIAMFLAGRTSFILTLLLLFIYIIIDSKLNLVSYFKYLVSIVFFLFVVSILFNFYVPSNIKQKFESTTFVSFNQLILSINDSDDFASTYGGETAIGLKDHLILPENVFILLFGNGNDGRGRVYIPSDIGYIKWIYGVGLLGSIIIYSLYLMIYYLIYKRLGSEMQNLNLVIIGNLLMIILLHAKEQVILTRHAFSITFILFVFSILKNNGRKRINIQVNKEINL